MWAHTAVCAYTYQPGWGRSHWAGGPIAVPHHYLRA